MKVRQRTTCQTCRGRKISCDGKAPSCSQCLFRDLHCPGYPPDWIFVSPNDGHDGKRSTISATGQPSRLTAKREVRKRAQTGDPGVSAVPQQSDDVPFSKLIATIIQGYVPGPDVAALDMENGSTPRICGAWAEVLPDLAQQSADTTLTSAIRAFAFSVLVRHENEKVTVSMALEAYTSALRSVHEALQAASSPSVVELIAAVMCLLFAELLLPTTLESWATHLEGLGELIQACGPDYFISGVPHRLFVGARPALVVLAIQSRKSSFLARGPWKAVPFQEIPPSSVQTLLAEAAVLPALIERLDKLPGIDMGSAKVALDELVDLHSRLKSWENSFLATRQQPQFRNGILREYGKLWFDSLTTANGLTHAWAFQVICLANIGKINSSFSELSHDTSTALPDISLETKRLSIMICQSMEFLMQDEMKLFGPTSGVLPLQTAYETFRDGGSDTNTELRWCEELLAALFKDYQFLSLFFDGFNIESIDGMLTMGNDGLAMKPVV